MPVPQRCLERTRNSAKRLLVCNGNFIKMNRIKSMIIEVYDESRIMDQ